MIGWRCWKMYDDEEDDSTHAAVKYYKEAVAEKKLAAGPALFPVGLGENSLETVFTWAAGPRARAFGRPDPSCTTGLYVYKWLSSMAESWIGCRLYNLATRKHTNTEGYTRRRGLYCAVIGEVEVAGHVVEHEYGYRAEEAMIRRLYLPAVQAKAWGASLCTALAARYQVPVSLFDVAVMRYPCCFRHEQLAREDILLSRYNHFWNTQLASALFTAFMEGGVRPHG